MSYKAVADHLKSQADRLEDQEDRESFLRTAFNRYYYSIFLQTRQMLVDCGQWTDKLSHKDVPEVLTKKMLTFLKKQAQGARNTGTSAQGEHKSVIVAKGALCSQANLLRAAYKVRVEADYFPNIRIDFQGAECTLGSTSTKQAANWDQQSRKNLHKIYEGLRGLGLVN